jgi:hypothetical protein
LQFLKGENVKEIVISIDITTSPSSRDDGDVVVSILITKLLHINTYNRNIESFHLRTLRVHRDGSSSVSSIDPCVKKDDCMRHFQ